ncbi:MAG: major capsid protein [Geminicoccaceae bacterium]
MSPSMDVFNSDAFSVQSLTAAINETPFVPGRLGQLGIFEEQGITTTAISIERQGETLALVPVTPRGGVPTPHSPGKRSMRLLETVRLALTDAVYADEVQNVRAFGSEEAVETVVATVNRRNEQMGRKLDVTLEHHRIGAIKGVVYDSDGTQEIHNLFTIFGVTQYAEINFDLANVAPASGAVSKKCSEVIRKIEDELGGLPATGVQCMCGSAFFDDLIAHSEIRDTFQAQNAAQLRERTARRSLFYGGITFEEYRGKVGSIQYIPDDKAHFFPLGVPGLFLTRFAPADYEETVNTLGLPRYAKQAPDPDGMGRKRVLEVQSNPINLCTRPKVLIKARRT